MFSFGGGGKDPNDPGGGDWWKKKKFFSDLKPKAKKFLIRYKRPLLFLFPAAGLFYVINRISHPEWVSDSRGFITLPRGVDSLEDLSDSSERCPRGVEIDYDRVLRLARANREDADRGVSIYRPVNRRQHFYIHFRRLGTVEAMSQQAGISVFQMMQLFSHPMFWLGAWITNMPFGGARLIPTSGPRLIGDGSRVSLTSGGDPIEVGQVSSLVVPRPQLTEGSGPTMSIPRRIIHRFEAYTLRGHALSGTVSHNLIIDNGEVFVLWVGLGYGPPLIGGTGNNIVACHPYIGIWPNMTNNLIWSLHNPIYWGHVRRTLLGFDSGQLDFSSLAALYLNAALHVQGREGFASLYLGALLSHGGLPLRIGSRVYGYLSDTSDTIKGKGSDDDEEDS